MRTPARPVRRLPLQVPTLLLALGLGLGALSGCSVGADGGASEDGGPARDVKSGEAGGEDSAGAPTGGGAVQDTADQPVSSGSGVVAPAVLDRRLARRADIALTVPDVDAAAARVRSIAAAAQGIVLSESVSSEPELPETGGFSTITISVPGDRLDATLDQVARVGEVHSRNTSTTDVTAQFVDTESRVATMQASVERVRALMGEATRIADIVSLEAELSRRQSDLESLQSQLAALKDAVALSPVEVRLSTDEAVLEDADDDTGFLAGLAAGWGAFTTSVTVLLTAVGAVLPFALVAALVVVPLALWLRRRGARPIAPVTSQPEHPTA